MRKSALFILSLFVLLALAGCGAASVSSAPVSVSAVSSDVSSSPAPASETPRPTPENPDEARLLKQMQDTAGREMMRHLYLDMDRDGAAELLGVCLNPDTHLYETWYCSSDGQTCVLAEQDKAEMEGCFLDPLEMDTATHVAVNRVLSTDTRRFSILALEDGQIRCLVSWQTGMVSMTEEGDLKLSAFALNALYDPAVKGTIGLGEKHSYLLYQNGGYVECGATELSEEDFLALANASELMAAIEHELRFETADRIERRYLLRPNGILQIQCALYNADGGVEYGYFTARCQNGTVDPALIGRFVNGQLESTLTTLDVIY